MLKVIFHSVKSFHTSFYLVKPPHARLELWVYYCKFIVYFRGDLFFVQSRLITLSTQQQILLIQSVSQQDFFWVKAHIKVQYSSRMCGSWQAKLQPNIVHLAVILFTQLLCSLQQPVVRNSSGTPKRRDFLQQPHSASQTMPIVKWAERRFGASQRTGLCFQFVSDWLQTFPVKPHSAVSDGSSISDNDYYLNVYKSTRHLSHE